MNRYICLWDFWVPSYSLSSERGKSCLGAYFCVFSTYHWILVCTQNLWNKANEVILSKWQIEKRRHTVCLASSSVVYFHHPSSFCLPLSLSPPPTLSPSPHPYFSFPLYSFVCTCVCMCVSFSGHPSCVLRQVLSLACNVPCRPGRLSGLSQGSVCLCLSSTAITSASPTPCFLFSPWLPGWNLGPLVCRTGTLPLRYHSRPLSVCLPTTESVPLLASQKHTCKQAFKLHLPVVLCGGQLEVHPGWWWFGW